ncbi:MAG: AAA domain-containing protein [Saprospiraceae bacterium]|nr:AAA domain-containing protein [Saprospiraceae bacterium]
MEPLQSLINQVSFFTDCYKQENQNIGVDRIGKHNVELYRIHLLDEDLILLRDGIQMTRSYRIELAKVLKIYKKEKEVKVYLFGLHQDEVTKPLFIYNGRLVEDYGRYVLRMDTDSVFVNISVIEQCTNHDVVTLKTIEDKLYDLAQSKEVTSLMLLELWTIFDQYDVPYTLSENLDLDVKGIKKLMAFGVVKKSTNTRGIMEDLDHVNKLSEYKSLEPYSAPLKTLFTSNNQNSEQSISLDYKLLPYTLSYGQFRVFDSIKTNTISVLIGPPGTGKTFTLVTLALEAVRTGRSILICAKTDQALDVIEKKLKHEFDNQDLILRVGAGNHAKRLKQIVSDFKQKRNVRPISKSEIRSQRKTAQSQFKIIRALEQKIETQLEREDIYGRIVYKTKKSVLERVKQIYLEYQISKDNKITKDVSRLRNLYKARYRVNKELVNKEHDFRVFKNYESLKENLPHYQKSLVARNSITYAEYNKNVDFKKLTKILPIWLVKMSDLNRSIPMKKELFDFLFVDEASQCEVTLGIPALQRAKKAIVAGDPKQLNHVSFLPNAFISKSKERHHLEDKAYFDYRRYSLLDMVDAVTVHSDNEGVLEEHYRSQPSIIGFNNRYFYGDRLQVMTAHGSHKSEDCVHFLKVEGKQQKDNTNTEELEFIIKEVEMLFEHDKNKPIPRSIGIISPFRNQTDLFKRYALKHLDSENIERHDVLIGTPFEFQGEERDVVFISFALDNESASGSFAYLSRENMFNVATSRAKAEQYIVHSFNKERISKGGLLHSFFHHQHHHDLGSSEAKDVFAKDVISALKENGVSSITQDETISGRSIDLLIHGNKKDLCIDLIGYEGAYDSVLNLEEIESLFRSEKHVYILPYRHWEKNKSQEIKAIVSKLTEINKTNK